MTTSYLRLQKAASKSCTSKHGYETRREAWEDAERLSALRGYPLYVYRCPACRGWHLTRREQQSAF